MNTLHLPLALVLAGLAAAGLRAQTAPRAPSTGSALAPAVDAKAAFPGWKASFDQYAAQAAEETRSGTEAADHTFLNELRTLEQNLADDGDLEKILVVQEEIKAFEFARNDPSPEVLKSLPELAPAAAALRVARVAAQRNGHTTYAKYATPYTRRLAELEMQASRKGDVEFAADLRAERGRVETRLKVALDFLAANPDEARPAPGDKPKTAAPKVLPAFTRSLTHLAGRVLAYVPFDTDWRRAAPAEVAGLGFASTATNTVFNARGKRGGAADLTRASQFVLHRHAALGQLETFSVCLWFRTKEPTSNLLTARYEVDEDGDAISDPPLNLRLRENGRVVFSVGEHRVASNRDQLGNNAWHHVVAVRTKDELSLYLDGEPAGSARVKGEATLSLPDLVVGWETSHSSYSSRTGEYTYYKVRFNGTMDEMVILDAPLNAQDVKTIFQSQK